MVPLRWILENREEFHKSMEFRGRKFDISILENLDIKRKKILLESENMQAMRNKIAKEIGLNKASGIDVSNLLSESDKIKSILPQLEENLGQIDSDIEDILLGLPNILDHRVPQGVDESSNVEIKCWGKIPEFSFIPKEHFDIAPSQMDFISAAKISGSRFVVLKSDLAKLERVLGYFMLEHNTARGYTEISPPILTKAHAFYGTGQLPKFEGNFFEVEGGMYIIPTAEVSLTNIVRESVTPEHELPLRMTACTPCFRSEAGASGRDTRGMIRMHQFYKCELVTIASPTNSEMEHLYMLETAELLLQKLGLPYRVLILCSGDTGGTASLTYDIEVYLPGQGRYREIASISNTHAYQANRMQAKYKRASDKKNDAVHTLNGSSLAVGRTMIAILENYQQADGSVKIPEILKNLMGKTEISAKDL